LNHRETTVGSSMNERHASAARDVTVHDTVSAVRSGRLSVELSLKLGGVRPS